MDGGLFYKIYCDSIITVYIYCITETTRFTKRKKSLLNVLHLALLGNVTVISG